ncbi:chemotaxis protein CheR [bacterium]|nr:chemotaxis protein CheR [candidate division CSSED10-310 bacterium]
MAFTYFFRDTHTLEKSIEQFVPFVIGYQNIYIWDAGCASGQEAYSLAMLCAEHMGYFAFKNLQIDATDIDASNLFADIIRRGLYPSDQVQRIPPYYHQKYFTGNEKGDHYGIDSKLCKHVRFYKHDLLSLQPIRTNYSLIVCKNVLLHFNEMERRKIMALFYQCLRSGGFLAMEQTQKMIHGFEDKFTLVATDAQLYRKIDTVDNSMVISDCKTTSAYY